MKKFAIILLVAAIVPACIFAADRGFFDFTLGATASTSYSIDDIRTGEIKNFTIDSVRFGADAEFKFAIFSVDGKVFYDHSNKGISGIVSANIIMDVFFVRIKAGLGYQYAYNFERKEFYFGNALDEGYATKFADFKKANFDANVGVDFLLGPVTVGTYATLPTATCIEKGNWGDFFKAIGENWKYAKLGVSVGYAFL